jgi:hypothetical protein
MKDVKINCTYESMVEDIFVLICVMGMIYSKGNNRSSLKVIIVIKDQEGEKII